MHFLLYFFQQAAEAGAAPGIAEPAVTAARPTRTERVLETTEQAKISGPQVSLAAFGGLVAPMDTTDVDQEHYGTAVYVCRVCSRLQPSSE